MMDWTNPHFAEPHWLWMAVAAPAALLALNWYAALARKEQLAKLASGDAAERLTRSHSPAKRRLKNVLLAVAAACAGLALARPQWGQLAEQGQSLGQDVVFVLDCSQSMLATDVSPNRLERARLAILDFVRRERQGRVGLVAFAGQAFIQCPLTYDYNAFQDSLRAVDEKTIPVLGTDIGRALDEAFQASENKKGPKIAILITDGEDLEKSSERVAQQRGKQNMVVFTIGVGTPAGSEVRVLNAQGRPEVLRDSKGQVVVSRLDEPALRRIAAATGGAYYPLGALGEGLVRVQSALKEGSDRIGLAPRKRLGVERFHFPLALMVLCLIAESLIGTRRKLHESRGDATRIAVSAAIFLLAVPAIAQEAPGSTSAPALRKMFNEAAGKLREEKYREAETMLESVLASQREEFQPQALYNLGHARFAEGVEELKKSEEARPTAARGRAAAMRGEEVVSDGREALGGNDIQRLLGSYMQGRGALKDVRTSMKAVKRALQFHAAALNRWERAAGDWKSTCELDPKNADARHNAEVADRSIAKLIDSIRELEQAMQAMQANRDELKGMMQQLKGRIPEENMPPGAPGDEEEDDEGMPQPQKGDQESAGQQGEERPMSPEEAGWMLEGFKSGEEKRLPMTEGAEQKPRDKNRPTW